METSPSSNQRPLVFGKRVSLGFKERVINMATELGTDPDYLMAAMAFESGGTFSPRARNPYSGAVGLIQFMPHTATCLGTRLEDLAAMTPEEQLEYVSRYFSPYKGRLKTLEDVYMAVLWPSAVGRPSNYVLFEKGNICYTQNHALDLNDDGRITKSEAAAVVFHALEDGRRFLA